MPEKGAPPKVSTVQRKVLNAFRALTSPLLPDDYLELINPLWSTRELRGKIEAIEPETDDAATVVIKPGYRWEGHEPGQYLRIGVDIRGVRHWRAYSLTSDPEREDGCISITIKNVDEGTVSPALVRRGEPGTIVSLGGVEGDFVLPDELPDKLLFISAGSGITPIMSMLRSLAHRDEIHDVALIHSARHDGDVIFGEQLRELEREHDGLTLHEQHTKEMGRLEPKDLDRLCPDWKERETFMSGPAEMLDAMTEYFEEHGDCDRLHMERFQPTIAGGDFEEGEGGLIKFIGTDCETVCDGKTPILVAGEEEGLDLPYGCREGICHTCVGELRSGKVRDLRSGKVYGNDGEQVRTCISAPEGPIEIEIEMAP
ncbi:MAG: stearoyl-CoA 9-desaturase oxidoreductase [Thermoleophilaceae bacterium]|nr:stearoyl-CoA 9-desaturase oxidoreductase [Thermoleophilaceae bacterium]